jgi:hypothetical protein
VATKADRDAPYHAHIYYSASEHWIGKPVDLDLDVLDPPGTNRDVARFGKTDF